MSQTITIPGPGDRIADRYEVLEELGRGSYGVVFRAREAQQGREVALKTLLPQSFLDEEIIKRFEREAQTVSRLRHVNIIELYDYGQHNGLIYMATEYVEGRSLTELMRDDTPMAPSEALILIRQLLEALGHAHHQGVVHRDLKPDNILLLKPDPSVGRYHETVKVLDFGIAKLVRREGQDMKTLTQAGHVLGTPHYMSPEQIVGDVVDRRADLYAIGVILHELLSGEHPFDAQNSTAVMVRHLRDDAPELPFGLEQTDWGEAVRRALAKQPEERLGTAEEFLGLLTRNPPPIPDRTRASRPTPMFTLDAVRAQRSTPSPAPAPMGFGAEPIGGVSGPDQSFSALPTLSFEASASDELRGVRAGASAPGGDEDPTHVYTNVSEQLAAMPPPRTTTAPIPAIGGPIGYGQAPYGAADHTPPRGTRARSGHGVPTSVLVAVAALALVMLLGGIWIQQQKLKQTDPNHTQHGTIKTTIPPIKNGPPTPTRPTNPLIKEDDADMSAAAAADMGAPDQGATARVEDPKPKDSAPKEDPRPKDPPSEPKERPSKRPRTVARPDPPKAKEATPPVDREAAFITLSVQVSNPSNPQVAIDGVPVGTAPLTKRIARGQRPIKVRISNDLFEPVERTLIPDKDLKISGISLKPAAMIPSIP